MAMDTPLIIITITTVINFIVGVYLLYNHYEQKEINIDNEMDIEDALSKLNVLQRKLEDKHDIALDYIDNKLSQLKEKVEKDGEDIIKRIPSTNDEVIKEVKKMRDDFLALRQNF
tara:strand:+ start:2844 stop:3188 length:345 start_codon:yes stop_codon:yes gene_type:complete